MFITVDAIENGICITFIDNFDIILITIRIIVLSILLLFYEYVIYYIEVILYRQQNNKLNKI